MNIYGESTNKVSERELMNAKTAFEAAKESFVLLKNDGALPLKETHVALFGNGARRTLKGGTGSGSVNNRFNISIEEGLENKGIQVVSKKWLDDYDEEYENQYQNWENWIEENGTGSTPNDVIFFSGENPFKVPQGRIIDQNDISEANCSTAIYVVSRQAGEAKDRDLEKGDYLLTDEETENLIHLSKNYDKLVLLINVGGVMDLTIQDKIRIDAIVHYGQAGQSGGDALAEILTGKDNFSGKLTQTWANQYQDYPYAMEYSHLNGDLLNANYKENIFVGYRYFDTFDVKPLYPFGYGLSYTQFSHKIIDVLQSKSRYTVTVRVNNEGNFDGKEIIQMYLKQPLTSKPIESQKLVAYKKTPIISAGNSTEISLSFDISDFGMYDVDSASWVLQEGKYILAIGADSRDTADIAEINVGQQLLISQLTNQFEVNQSFEEISLKRVDNLPDITYDYTFKLTESDIKVNKITYNEQKSTISKEIQSVLDKFTNEEMIQLVVGGGVGRDGKHTIVGASGKTTTKLGHHGIDNIVMADGPAGLNIVNSVLYDKDENQIPLQVPPQYNFGLFKKLAERNMNIEGQRSYRYATAWPSSMNLAQTWNHEILYSVGKGTGKEMLDFGITLWLAPGLNIQRNPLCGRNFEYFSEDPLLSGLFASEITKGVQSNPGVGVTLKHYAVNNQEDNRVYYSSNVSERALREIYLKGFELAVKSSEPWAVMTSYNKLNGVYAPNSKALCTKVLRREWGFEGVVMTDWNSTQGDKAVPSKAIESGNDLMMPGTEEDFNEIKHALESGYLSTEDLYFSAARILNIIVASDIYSK